MRTYLYRCFDRDNQLLYAGVAEDVERRRAQHAKEKYWWADVVRVTCMAFRSRQEALWAEWAVITTCHPVYNRSAVCPAAPTYPPPEVRVGQRQSARKPRRTTIGECLIRLWRSEYGREPEAPPTPRVRTTIRRPDRPPQARKPAPPPVARPPYERPGD